MAGRIQLHHLENRRTEAFASETAIAQTTGRYLTLSTLMKNPWFKRWGWLHLPITWPGAALCLFALAFCVQVFLAVDRRSHSASDTLYGAFPFFASCFLLLN